MFSYPRLTRQREFLNGYPLSGTPTYPCRLPHSGGGQKSISRSSDYLTYKMEALNMANHNKNPSLLVIAIQRGLGVVLTEIDYTSSPMHLISLQPYQISYPCGYERKGRINTSLFLRQHLYTLISAAQLLSLIYNGRHAQHRRSEILAYQKRYSSAEPLRLTLIGGKIMINLCNLSQLD